jgi:hypothetical protein
MQYHIIYRSILVDNLSVFYREAVNFYHSLGGVPGDVVPCLPTRVQTSRA